MHMLDWETFAHQHVKNERNEEGVTPSQTLELCLYAVVRLYKVKVQAIYLIASGGSPVELQS